MEKYILYFNVNSMSKKGSLKIKVKCYLILVLLASWLVGNKDRYGTILITTIESVLNVSAVKQLRSLFCLTRH